METKGMAFWNRDRKKQPTRPTGRDLDQIVAGSWDEFEEWIRTTIGGAFIWKVRPRDTRANREMVIESICEAVERNGGSFPKHDAFLERDDA